MTDPKPEQDELVQALSTWERKIEKRIDDFSPADRSPEKHIQLGFLMAALDLLETLRDTIEEHGLPG